ncbi:MAG: hypothetical protein ACHQIO_13280 [Nevskiales bacterium]
MQTNQPCRLSSGALAPSRSLRHAAAGRMLLLAALATVTLLQTGCVTGRRYVPLTVPDAAATPSRGPVRVATVADDRNFQNKPDDPSIPSIDGDVTSMSAELKASMIGRQRSTYGHAMGDIALPADQSVPVLARLLVEQGLKRHGYELSADAMTPKTVNVSIDKFWAWGTPGLFSIAFEAQLYCKFTVNSGSGPKELVVVGYGKNNGQVASDGNWQKAYDLAFQDFLAQFDKALTDAGL